MANYRKSFNFRNGVQVDDDNLVVNANGLVGIGTTVPTELLDVRGTAKVVGQVTANELNISGVSTFSDVRIGTGITVDASAGIITATKFFGDGATLSNLPTSQWVDVDVGLGFTSIYAQGNVGVGTTDPRSSFQVGEDPYNGGDGVGFSSVTGDVRSSGIITASSFVGSGAGVTSLNASNILTGTISTDRVPQLTNAKLPNNISVSGIITASGGFSGDLTGDVTGDVTGNVTGNVVGILTGDVTGTATTATSLSGTPDITVGTVTATRLIANSIDVPSTGITTVSQILHVGSGGTFFSATIDGIGIGTADPSVTLQIKKASGTSVEVIADSGESKVNIGNSVGSGDNVAVLRYGNSANAFDVINRDTGNLNMVLHGGGSGIGTGTFNWLYGQTNAELMSLTHEGRLGLGITNPTSDLHVVGTSTVTGNAGFGADVTIAGTLTAGNLTLPSFINSNVHVTSGISTFDDVNVLDVLEVRGSIGIGTSVTLADFDGTGRSGIFGTLGVGTAAPVGSALEVVGTAIFDGIGIGTTASGIYGLRIDEEEVQLNDTPVGINSSTVALDANSSLGIGVTTGGLNCAVDFSNAGAASTVGRFMLPPRLTNAQRAGLTTVSGAIIYNTDTNKHQGYDGTTWNDFY